MTVVTTGPVCTAFVEKDTLLGDVTFANSWANRPEQFSCWVQQCRHFSNTGHVE